MKAVLALFAATAVNAATCYSAGTATVAAATDNTSSSAPNKTDFPKIQTIGTFVSATNTCTLAQSDLGNFTFKGASSDKCTYTSKYTASSGSCTLKDAASATVPTTAPTKAAFIDSATTCTVVVTITPTSPCNLTLYVNTAQTATASGASFGAKAVAGAAAFAMGAAFM